MIQLTLRCHAGVKKMSHIIVEYKQFRYPQFKRDKVLLSSSFGGDQQTTKTTVPNPGGSERTES